MATKPGHRPRLIYRTHRARRENGQHTGLTETDYARLLDAAHRQPGGPIMLLCDVLNTTPARR